MAATNWEIVCDHRCLIGECPVWDSKNNRIFWIDIHAGHIHYFYPGTLEYNTFHTGQMIGCMVLKSSNQFIAALQSGFFEIDISTSKITPIISVEGNIPDNRFNDGKCDPAGRFWAGTMSVTGIPGAGKLYTLEKNHTVSVKLDNVSCSNGMAWNKKTQTYYYIDTPSQKVVAYDYNDQDGSITNGRIVVVIPRKDGYPDGMTIDQEGMLWIALWGGWKVVRYNPSTGKQILKFDLPVSKVSSCTFGGDNMDDLYITSAKIDLNEKELVNQPHAGKLFVIKNSGFAGMQADVVKI